MRRKRIFAGCAGATALLLGGAAVAATIDISAHDIGGQVIGDKGPEAGVWVIAETKDFPTKFAKVVVTDDQGRFVIPDLPDANYKVWVRGYGLQDTAQSDARPGKQIDFKAAPAPSAAAAAQLYPGMYWYSMLDIPAPQEFPGTGDKGNKMPETMKARRSGSIRSRTCASPAMRSDRAASAKSRNRSWTATTCIRRGRCACRPARPMEYMAVALGSMGPEKVYSLFSKWTDRLAEGELPFDKPERPKGIERNAVYTMWDWASPKHYQHDAISTDKRNPTVNANGLIYGSPEESTDLVPTLDPVKNIASTIKHPYLDPKTPSSQDAGRGPSAYWGDEAIWDGHTSIHNVIMDGQGKVWFTARLRPPENPDYCKQGSSHPSAKVTPQATSLRQLSRFDPMTGKWDLINTCFSTHHLYFAHDPNDTLWMSAGGPGLGGGIVGWLNAKQFRATLDGVASQGWTPLIIDTNGNGKRDAYVEAKDPLDPIKDKRIAASFYGIQPSPVDESIWGQAMDRGFSRIDQPGYIVRVMPGPDPANTALAEVYQPPEGSFGPRGIDLGLDGIVWTVLSSGHLASFDRTLCKGPLNGPTTAEGKQCAEGWKLYRLPGPQFKGIDPRAARTMPIMSGWIATTRSASARMCRSPAQTAASRCSRWSMARSSTCACLIRSASSARMSMAGSTTRSAGWKGRGIWTTSGTRANFHSEGGKDAYPKVFKMQMRPDPLAH